MTSNNCPLCKREGESVSLVTVENLIKDYFRKHLKSSFYYFCSNPTCNVVYFNNERDEIYFQRDLKIEVGIKEQSNPIICYCRNVTLKDIIDEIVVKGTSHNLEDIKANTGACRGIQCKTHNPSGKCCSESLKDAVDYALKLKNKE